MIYDRRPNGGNLVMLAVINATFKTAFPMVVVHVSVQNLVGFEWMSAVRAKPCGDVRVVIPNMKAQ